MSGDVVMAAVVTAIPVLVLWRGLRPVDERELRRWADRFGPTLDHQTRPHITRALRRGRRLRAAGAAAGIVVAAAPAYMNLVDPARSSDVAGPVTGLAWVFGAALGSTVAEVAFVQRPSGRRVATLERRRWQHYVPVPSVAAVVVAAIVASLAAAVALARRTSGSGEAVALAIAATIAVLCLVAGLRQIVGRPRLSVDGRLRVVDEALRADGAHRLAGATFAMAGASALVGLSEATWDLVPLLGLAAGLLQHAAFGWWWVLSRDVVWRMDAAAAAA